MPETFEKGCERGLVGMWLLEVVLGKFWGYSVWKNVGLYYLQSHPSPLHLRKKRSVAVASLNVSTHLETLILRGDRCKCR